MNPILVKNTRGGVVESFHRGSICVVDESGKVIWSLGDVNQVSFPRSALKLFQHLPLLVSGAFDAYGFTEKDLALMCGSHNGEIQHTTQVQSMLNTLKLEILNLKCGAQPPTLKSDFVHLIKSNQEPSAIHNNCSGKHSGFLAYCQYNQLPLDSYLDESHPLHQAIKKVTAQFYEIDEKNLIVGVDGCSAPIFGMPLYNQALAYKNLAASEKFGSKKLTESCERILSAIARNPEMIAGTKRYCTDLIRVTKGRIIGKTGADGVYSLCIPEKKWGIGIKVDDGKMGPQYQIAHELLQELKLITHDEAEELEAYGNVKVKNYAGNEIGDSLCVDLNCNI